jgi:peptidylprolyl isomerase
MNTNAVRGLMLALPMLALAACGDSATPPKDSAEKSAEAPAKSETAAPPPAEAEAVAPAPAAAPAGGGNTIVMQLKDGDVVIELRPDLAPKHVERIKTLTKQGFYNGLKFHRVIDGFMAQTGDPTGTGAGGSDLGDLKAEFTSEPFVRGTVGAARTRNPDSANSQFFICFNDTGCKTLTGAYTVFGKVVVGMDHVDKIKKGERAANGVVSEPDTIVKMYVP